MFKKILYDIVNFFKAIFNNQTIVNFVARDVSELVKLVMVRDYVGAAKFLVEEARSVQEIDAEDIKKQAKQLGVDIASFEPIIKSISMHLLQKPSEQVNGKVQDKANDSIFLIRQVIGEA